MRRWLCLFALLLCSCGAVTFRGSFQPGFSTATGFVSFVQLTVVSDGNGGMVNVTIVTLTQAGIPSNFTFCGSQRTLFPIDSTIEARFTPGVACGTIIAVVILQHG